VLEPSFITPYEDIILMPTLGKEKYMKEVSVTFNCLHQLAENEIYLNLLISLFIL